MAEIFPSTVVGHLAVSISTEPSFLPAQPYLSQCPSDESLLDLAAAVDAWFRRGVPGIRVREVMLTCSHTFYVFLAGPDALIDSLRRSLPEKIANCPAGYLPEGELHPPGGTGFLIADGHIWGLDRVEEPPRGPVDDTAYPYLRPGVLTCSKSQLQDPTTLVATSGVLIRDAAGNTFMTSVGGGRNMVGGTVRGPNNNPLIGETASYDSVTDMSLVKLSGLVNFTNETFRNSSGVGTEFPGGLMTLAHVTPWRALCYLDSPYTGNVEGNLMAKSVRIEATPDNLNGTRAVVYNWTFMGQGEGHREIYNSPNASPGPFLPAGAAGSVVWDEDGLILGFHHHYISSGRWAGFACSVSASAFAQLGYTVAR